MRYDFRTPRLFVEAPLAEAAQVVPSREQLAYLTTVLRLGAGAPVLLFNGRDGEWRARLSPQGRREAVLEVQERVRPQTAPGDVWLMFAPLKHARLDYMAQKAVEMGVSRLQPVMTRRTQATRVNLDRLAANAIEAAEQCGVLSPPQVVAESSLPAALAGLDAGRLVIFCDEDAEIADPVAALAAAGPRGRPVAVLIGPEGGFDPAERAMLLARPAVLRLSLGPRILRADTAAVVALALVQAGLGDLAGDPGGGNAA